MMDTMKRTSSQSYENSPANGANIRELPGQALAVAGVPEQAQGSAQGDGNSKKARLVTEGQYPAQDYSGAMGGGALPYGQMLQNVPSGYLNAAALSSLASQQQQHQQQHQHHLQQPSPHSPSYGVPNGGSRSFSGSMMSPSGNIPGLPSPNSSYMSQQYAAISGNGHNGQQPNAFASASYMPSQSPMGGVMFPPGYQNVAMQGGQGMGAFIPNVGLVALPQQSNATGRTVYVGNLPADASVDELLNQVKFGPIENIRLLPEKSCAFLSFLDGGMAAAFHADASVKKMSLHNQELKIGWGKPSACPTPILMAVQQSQATRNVYLGQLDEDVTEQSLRDDLARFGPIDQVKIVRDKNIGFIHFLSIGTAMKVVSMLPTEPAWAGKRVNYGKDRCAYVPKSQQQNQAHNSQAAAMGMAAAASLGYPTAFMPGGSAPFSNYGALNPGAIGNNSAANASFASSGQGDDSMQSPTGNSSMFGPMGSANVTALQQIGNRTVYLGNIHPDTTTEEICNHIRGGILQNIRFITEKHIAFITFVDSNAALAFYHLATYSGILIHQRRLKIGWGKHSGPLSPAIAMAVQAGGSRNVYVGNIEDFELHTVEKLRRDFSEYGETELVNTLKEKNCAFINFCNIQNAIKAIEAMKNHADYQNQRIGAGKDRCGNRECSSPREDKDFICSQSELTAPRVMNNNNLNAGQDSTDSHSPSTSAFLAAGQQNSSMDESSGEMVDASIGAIGAPEESTDSLLTSS
jgi:RNA recognition motif-containing protein